MNKSPTLYGPIPVPQLEYIKKEENDISKKTYTILSFKEFDYVLKNIENFTKEQIDEYLINLDIILKEIKSKIEEKEKNIIVLKKEKIDLNLNNKILNSIIFYKEKLLVIIKGDKNILIEFILNSNKENEDIQNKINNLNIFNKSVTIDIIRNKIKSIIFILKLLKVKNNKLVELLIEINIISGEIYKTEFTNQGKKYKIKN